MNLFGDVIYMGRSLVVNDTEAAKKAWESRERKREAAPESDVRDLKNNLGFERIDMPQIARGDQKEFVNWARKQGVTVEKETARTLDLKPTQTQYDQARVDAMTPHVWADKKDKPVLISSDNRVLDGTHHWMKHQQEDNLTMPVLRIGLPARMALTLMNKFPKTQHRGVAFTGNARLDDELAAYLLYNARREDDEDRDEDDEDIEWATDADEEE